MLTRIFFDVLEMNIAASLIVLLLAVLGPRLDKSFRCGWRKAFWIAAGVRLLIPYNFSWDTHAIHLFSNLTKWQMSHAAALSAAVFLSAVWVMGLLVCLRHRYLCYKKFYKEIVENSRESYDEKELRIFREVMADIGVKKEVVLYHCALISTPMVVSALEPMLLLPEAEYSEEELRMIFCHEGMHIDNFDIVYKMVMMTVEAVHWFNPFIHKMVKASYRDVELFCDGCVTEDMSREERGRYGKTILDAAAGQQGTDSAFSTCFYGSASIMKQRMEHLFHMENKKRGICLFVAFLALFAMLGIFIKCGV